MITMHLLDVLRETLATPQSGEKGCSTNQGGGTKELLADITQANGRSPNLPLSLIGDTLSAQSTADNLMSKTNT
jgi:hypothetical protein